MLALAVGSRLLLLCLALLSDRLLPDHVPSGVEELRNRVSEDFGPLRAFTKWDSVYYLNLAQHPQLYSAEKEFAFLPLYPSLIAAVSVILRRMVPLLSPSSTDVIAGLLISNTCFVTSHCILNEICNGDVSTRAMRHTILILHLLSPANVFFSSIYTESLYAVLSWSGILLLQRDLWLLSLLPFAAASCTRSNGSLNFIIIALTLLQRFRLRRAMNRKERDERGLVNDMVQLLMQLLVSLVATLLPFVVHNFFAHSVSCQSGECDTGVLNPLHFTSSYARIQEKYWDVGILKYWQIKQIPNFLLSLPVYILSILTIIRRMGNVKFDKLFLGHCLADPYVTHILALLAVCGLVAHVQVSTRVLLSACPHLYFEAAFLAARNNHFTICIFAYFVGYTLIGTILHVNYFPWT